MGGFKMGKKASDEQCIQNYKDMRKLFDSAIEDSSRFEAVYACGVDAGMSDMVVVRVTTYKYSSYAVGFDTAANEIAILPIAVDLSKSGQPYLLKRGGIKKAKQSFFSKAITIYDNQLPKKYIQIFVQEQISEDPDGVVLLVKQNEQAKRFLEFFKTQFCN
jgi:hypothetical protein